MELADGQKILSKGQAINFPIVTAGLTLLLDLINTSLLHNVHLISAIIWLQAVNPLIDWLSSLVFLAKDAGISVLSCNWLDQAHKVGTTKVLQDAATITALWDTEVQLQISVLRVPHFWSYVSNSARWFHCLKGEKGHVR